MSNKDIFDGYNKYCKEFGNQNSFKLLTIGKMMIAEKFTPKRTRGDRGWVIWKGGRAFNPLTIDPTKEEGYVSEEQQKESILPF